MTADTAPGALPIPEQLLVPLLEVAGTVLIRLDADQVPPVLRPLAGFDRRRLGSGPARQQLRRALEVDEGFRKVVVERFLSRAEVQAALSAWSASGAATGVEDVAERSDLPLLASTLWAAKPEAWQFGLGVACAAFDRQRRERELDDEARARAVQAGTADEARRRAEDARSTALRDAERLERELREERRARRERETRAGTEVGHARQEVKEAEALAARARHAAEEAEARFEREAARAREAERQLREARRELSARDRERATAPRPFTPAEVQALARGAERARELASELARLSSAATTPARRPVEPRDVGDERPAASEPAGGGSARATRGLAAVEPSARPVNGERGRAPVPCPPGMITDSPDALEAMLHTRGLSLVVDGYNVSMRAWPHSEPSEQRDRLTAGLARLHLRSRPDIVVVFDGADVRVPQPIRRPGIRVVFSGPGEEADHVVVREVSALPPRVPVVVVSSDNWVRAHAERVGATVVSSDTLLHTLRHQ